MLKNGTLIVSIFRYRANVCAEKRDLQFLLFVLAANLDGKEIEEPDGCFVLDSSVSIGCYSNEDFKKLAQDSKIKKGDKVVGKRNFRNFENIEWPDIKACFCSGNLCNKDNYKL